MPDQELHVKSTSQMLQDGLDEVFSSESYRRFLKFVANNPNYSYRNVLLILQQCPFAQKVMGFKAWIKAGRIVKQHERGLRINARFGKQSEDEDTPVPLSMAHQKKEKEKYKKISVFDISQTAILDDEQSEYPDEDAGTALVHSMPTPFETTLLEGEVADYDSLLSVLDEVAPLPVLFRSDVKTDGACGYADITIKKDMSQLHTVRTIIHQIVQGWRRAYCPDREQLEIESESVAFIVCQYLGLDTSEFSFHYIARYSVGKERRSLELFLDTIQKTALFLIDSIDGVREAQNIGYDSREFCLLVNPKTALRFFGNGLPVYLVFPGEGELLTMSKKYIEAHTGPFAIERAVWFDCNRLAA